jgi:YihY family inner membrane protein
VSIAGWLDRFQQRHPAAGFPLAVAYKFVDDQGNYLAALVTYYGFISLFPLLLLLTTILGFVLRNSPHLQQQIVDSTLSQFPVIGDQLKAPKGLTGNDFGLAVGILGSLYGGLGVALAAQNAMNVAWGVPRNERPNPIKARLRGLLLLLTVGLGVLVTTILSALSASAGAFGADVGAGLRTLISLGSVLINGGVFLLAFKVGTARDVGVRDIAVGAWLAALAWQGLQLLGTAYVGHVVKQASVTDSVFALVLGLIAWIYLAAVAVVFCVEVNVVRALRLYPRSLLTPFTDDVDLTRADESAYTRQAQAQRAKGFQQIDVTFDPDDDDGPADEGPTDEGPTRAG